MIGYFTLTHLVVQEALFEKSDKVFNLGIGFGSTINLGNDFQVIIPPLPVSGEVGIFDHIHEKGVFSVEL